MSKKTIVLLSVCITLMSANLWAATCCSTNGKGCKLDANDLIPLFDGKTLQGWVHDSVGKATYEVVDGAILGTTVEGSSNSFLLSEKESQKTMEF